MNEDLAPASDLALLVLLAPTPGAVATAKGGRITAVRTGETGGDDLKQRSGCFYYCSVSFLLWLCSWMVVGQVSVRKDEGLLPGLNVSMPLHRYNIIAGNRIK